MSDTIKLQAPGNCGPFDRAGVTYTIAPDGTVTVPGSLYDDLTSHGFLPFVERPAQTAQTGGQEGDDDPNSVPVEDISTMSRMALFAFLSALGVSAPPPITNDQLRAKARDAQAAAKAAANTPPAPPSPEPTPAAPAEPVTPPAGAPAAPAANPAPPAAPASTGK